MVFEYRGVRVYNVEGCVREVNCLARGWTGEYMLAVYRIDEVLDSTFYGNMGGTKITTAALIFSTAQSDYHTAKCLSFYLLYEDY